MSDVVNILLEVKPEHNHTCDSCYYIPHKVSPKCKAKAQYSLNGKNYCARHIKQACFDVLLRNTRATDCSAVDLEALKRELEFKCDTPDWNSDWVIEVVRDHLASRNLIRGAVESIEGLDKALEFCKPSGGTTIYTCHSSYVTMFEAAAKYLAMTKGE